MVRQPSKGMPRGEWRIEGSRRGLLEDEGNVPRSLATRQIPKRRFGTYVLYEVQDEAAEAFGVDVNE